MACFAHNAAGLAFAGCVSSVSPGQLVAPGHQGIGQADFQSACQLVPCGSIHMPKTLAKAAKANCVITAALPEHVPVES